MGIKGLMGVINEHAPGAVKELVIEGYTGRVVAIDASMSLYQFLIAIRHQGEGGAPSSVLTNAEGEQTSHIQGMFNRTIRLLQAGVRPVYVFDGKPPNMKGGELAKRTAKRQEAEAALKKATENDDAEGISKYSALLTKVSRKDCDDVKQLLRLMGVPVVDAPCEAEAQCAELVRGGKAHAVGTEDMDALTFGSTRQLRNMTFTKKSKDDKVLEITHAAVLEGLGLSNAEFVDFCILCGCDYTSTIRGVGPKTALKLVKEHGSIEAILAKGLKAKQRGDVPDEWDDADDGPFVPAYVGARNLFNNHEVTPCGDVELSWGKPDEAGLRAFLVERMGFGEQRVEGALKRLTSAQGQRTQRRMDSFFKVLPPKPGAAPKKRPAPEKKAPAKKKGKGPPRK
ncbi:hypothetical protein AURANDRAFT_19112 [Aureococcus anophagefferens]|uniref:Flap endonuclease 1 n=1 Tax=Aureococcus anophagefferens TaxID=44056 RepID=F0XX03_AURAN|nr:hypothetical protein AURANDRAFT_19112 [Aureococcus anophagefferens]EGB12872.1 hypothetical protein AURANDRAFT_19112 [Aureococcus anophagefferens]|eukprot:XP_009032501.1 hypothetical protein AURANDRAFT_19112 [Aureococcus anophagefferens]